MKLEQLITHRLAVLLIVFVALLVFGRSLSNQFIIGDDYDQILHNPNITKVEAIPNYFTGSTYRSQQSGEAYGLFYRPLMLSLYTLIYQIWGFDPLGFHLIQLIIHTLNALLVYILISWFTQKKVASLFGSLLFLVHPINSETVLHSANLQETVFLFFGMSAWLLVLQSKKKNSLLLKFIAMLVYTVALFGKETAILFLPFVGFAGVPSVLVYGFVRFFVADITYSIPEISLIGLIPTHERFLQVPAVLWFYLKTFLWPDRLVTNQFWLSPVPDYSAIFGLMGGITGLYFFQRKVASRYKQTLYLWICVAALGLLFHSQILPLYVTVAERWFYFASLGFSGIGATISLIIMENKRSQRWSIVFLSCIIGALSIRTYVRTLEWSSSRTLLEQDVLVEKGNYYNQNLLASIYIEDQDLDRALPLLESSVTQHSYVGNLSSLGIVLWKQGKIDRARQIFEKSLASSYTYYAVLNYANFLYFQQHDYDTALRLVDEHLIHYSKGYELWVLKALIEYRSENKEALSSAQNAYKIKPGKLTKELIAIVSQNKPLEPFEAQIYTF